MYLTNNSFLHVGITFAGTPKVRELEPWIQTLCNDWIRYSANNWIIWTSKSPREVAESMRLMLDPNDLILVVRIDTHDSSGFLPQWIWDWINRPRPPGWTPPPAPHALPPSRANDPLAGLRLPPRRR